MRVVRPQASRPAVGATDHAVHACTKRRHVSTGTALSLPASIAQWGHLQTLPLAREVYLATTRSHSREWWRYLLGQLVNLIRRLAPLVLSPL
jgi:hypothetical protein